MVYPLYVSQIGNYFKVLTQEDSPLVADSLQGCLKYMEDFVENKERTVVNMYTNAFMTIVGH